MGLFPLWIRIDHSEMEFDGPQETDEADAPLSYQMKYQVMSTCGIHCLSPLPKFMIFNDPRSPGLRPNVTPPVDGLEGSSDTMLRPSLYTRQFCNILIIILFIL